MAEWLTHPVFGDLRWEGEASWWFTQIRQESGEWLDVIIDPDDDDTSAFIERAAQLYCRTMAAEREILQEAIQKGLLNLYDKWRQADEPELTAEDLKNQCDLTFVRIDTVTPTTLSYAGIQ